MLSAGSPTDRPFALSIDVSTATLGSPTERPGSSCDGHAPLDGPSSRDTPTPGTWKKQTWKGNEDARLAELVASCAAEGGKVRWSVVGAQMQGRSGKQCRERWHNHLNPDVNKDPWSPGMSSGASLSVSSPRSLHFMLQRGTAVHSLH